MAFGGCEKEVTYESEAVAEILPPGFILLYVDREFEREDLEGANFELVLKHLNQKAEWNDFALQQDSNLFRLRGHSGDLFDITVSDSIISKVEEPKDVSAEMVNNLMEAIESEPGETDD